MRRLERPAATPTPPAPRTDDLSLLDRANVLLLARSYVLLRAEIHARLDQIETTKLIQAHETAADLRDELRDLREWVVWRETCTSGTPRYSRASWRAMRRALEEAEAARPQGAAR